VAGHFAHVADQAGGLQLDVNDPANPLPTGNYQTHALGVQ
jgi:hypothetical protein